MILLEFVPTYEYECPRCPRVFEVRQRISEPPLTTCDRCGGPVHRLLSATPFILKGGGWYVTDYPSESRKKAQSDGVLRIGIRFLLEGRGGEGRQACGIQVPGLQAEAVQADKQSKSDKSKRSGSRESKSGTSGSSSPGGAPGGTKSS